MRRLNREALEKHEERRLGRIIKNGGEKVVLLLFQDPERVKETVYTPVYLATVQVPVNAFITRAANQLLDNTMYKLAVSQDFTRGPLCHLIKSSTFNVAVARFVKQQPENPSPVKQDLDKT